MLGNYTYIQCGCWQQPKTEWLDFWSRPFNVAGLYSSPVTQLSCRLRALKCRVLPRSRGLSLYPRWHLSRATRLNIIQPFKGACPGPNYAVYQPRVQTSCCWVAAGWSADTAQMELFFFPLPFSFPQFPGLCQEAENAHVWVWSCKQHSSSR